MLNQSLEVCEKIANGVRQGFIFVDENKKISAYSELAKEILGITLPNVKSHKPGQILKGDIVILMDRDLGNDDGMTPQDLKTLNITDESISEGDTILAIGVYNNKKIQPVYKVFSGSIPGNETTLSQKYLGFNIECVLDLNKRKMTIKVNGEEYYMHYIDNIGFAVVLDKVTGETKFIQAKGYGYRKEELGELLRGKTYMGKNLPGEVLEFLPTIGMRARDILDGPDFLRDLDKLFDSPNGTCIEGTYDIYRRMVYCHLIRTVSPVMEGVAVLVQDIDLAQTTKSNREEFINKVEKAGSTRNKETEHTGAKFADYIGSSPALENVKELAYKASKTKFNVIILGESGTGKSKLAREIHNAQNSEAPFVEVQCNAIAPSLFESELFGYAPGSFTGADKDGKAGYFEAANGGTIFLDEIGDIPLEIQIKLLHVIQNKRIYRVGSTKPIDIDVRIITATNKDLEQEVNNGRFRQDLFYRINVFPITIPPLREHKRDLYILANHILLNLCKKYDMEEKQFSSDAIDAISNYDWPGNIRELENIIERAITVCDGHQIYSEHLMINNGTKSNETLQDKLEKEERRIIEDSLFKNNGDYKKCIEELGLSKSVFYERIKKYNLS